MTNSFLQGCKLSVKVLELQAWKFEIIFYTKKRRAAMVIV